MTERRRQVFSLTSDELAWLAEQIQALSGDWSIDVVRDPMEVSAVLIPALSDRLAAYLIDRVSDGYRLMVSRQDDLTAVGVFPALADAFASIAAASTAVRPAWPHRPAAQPSRH